MVRVGEIKAKRTHSASVLSFRWLARSLFMAAHAEWMDGTHDYDTFRLASASATETLANLVSATQTRASESRKRVPRGQDMQRTWLLRFIGAPSRLPNRNSAEGAA